jgi:uroporphyrinogen-III decarboxylase
MSSRDRVQAALNHQTPDRVPVDIGGTDISGVHASTYVKLRAALGLPVTVPKAYDTFQMLAQIDDDFRRLLGVDAVGLALPYTVFGYRNEGWKPFRMPDGTGVLVSRHFVADALPDGSLVQYPRGDRSYPPSGRMAADGFYFDVLYRQSPFDEKSLDAKRWVEETYGLCRDEDLRYLEEQSRWLRANTDYAVVADLNPAGFGGFVAMVAPHVGRPGGIRNPEEFWMSYLTRRNHIQDIFAHQHELQMKNLEMYRQALADRIDVIIMCKTDFGAQSGPLIAPATYRDLFKPLHRKMNDWVHANTSWKTFFHTCGDVSLLLEDFIEAGLDVLNPVQISADNMDPVHLKEAYGDRLAFWGGGISTQATLPFGTPEEVEAEVTRNLQVLGRQGGFVFAPDQNIQPAVPIENLMAMIRLLRARAGSSSGGGV